jgi:hypothetical protein
MGKCLFGRHFAIICRNQNAFKKNFLVPDAQKKLKKRMQFAEVPQIKKFPGPFVYPVSRQPRDTPRPASSSGFAPENNFSG